MGRCVFGRKWWPAHLLFHVNPRSSSTPKGLPLHTALRSSHYRVNAFPALISEKYTSYLLTFVEIVALEKTLESLSDFKEIQPAHPKGNQSWIFIGIDAEADAPILWPPDVKNWLTGNDPDAGKGWRQEEKGTTEDEMAGWHHRLYGHESGWTLGVGDGQGGLACCDSWGCKESYITEQLNWTELIYKYIYTHTHTYISIHISF